MLVFYFNKPSTYVCILLNRESSVELSVIMSVEKINMTLNMTLNSTIFNTDIKLNKFFSTSSEMK